MTDKEKIKYLSYDKAFGISTRPAIDLRIKGRVTGCIIDICGMGLLNHHLGYRKTNKIIFSIFEEFKKYGCISGRWFSGDEIIIIHPRIKEKIQLLENVADKYRIRFKKYFFKNKKIKEINLKNGE